MTAGETEMRYTDGVSEIYAERTPYGCIGEAGSNGTAARTGTVAAFFNTQFLQRICIVMLCE